MDRSRAGRRGGGQRDRQSSPCLQSKVPTGPQWSTPTRTDSMTPPLTVAVTGFPTTPPPSQGGAVLLHSLHSTPLH